uniref:DNA helicase n=1 Tax=Tanacetum cinerariifolium TaxID=118510 RepID=A0A6L2K4N2_TANCI|nr:DNA helicase [Tanacetum cinerariifolium]
MKTKSKSVKRKISDTDDVQSYTMGPSKKLKVRSPSTFTNLHEEGASSDEQKNETGIRDIHMYVQDATKYSSITGNNHISPYNTPASIHTQTTNYQQIGDITHTFETSRHQQPKFTTCSKRTHHVHVCTLSRCLGHLSRHGNPSFLITFTCNAKWPEIQEYMDSWPELTTADRADNVDNVFEQKYIIITGW